MSDDQYQRCPLCDGDDTHGHHGTDDPGDCFYVGPVKETYEESLLDIIMSKIRRNGR